MSSWPLAQTKTLYPWPPAEQGTPSKVAATKCQGSQGFTWCRVKRTMKLVTSATLVVTGALLAVTKSYYY